MPLVGVGHHQAFILPQHLTILVTRPSPSTYRHSFAPLWHWPGLCRTRGESAVMTSVRAHWKWIMVTIFNQVKTIHVTNRQRWWVSVMNGNSWRMTNERDGGTHNSVTCDIWCHHNMDTETLCTPLNTAQTRLFDLNQQREKYPFILSMLLWSSWF